jgi:outer membrane protein
MSKSYIGAVLRGVIGLAVAAALTLPVRAETLADALAAAYVNSGLIQQNRALLRAADEDVVIAASKLRPILQWSSSVKRSLSSGRIGSNGVYQSSDSTSTVASAGLVAELLIYDFGASKLAVQVKKEAVLGTRQKLLSVEQKVLIRAVEAFTNVRRDTEKVALRRSNLSLITEELRAAKDRFDVGEVTRTDVALAEARLAGSRSALAAAEGTLRVAVEEYRAAIGHAPKALNGSDKVLKPVKNLDAAKAIAVRQHPDIKELQHSVTVAELTLQQAQLAKKPIVKLSGSYGLTETLTSRAYGRSGEIK